jgi:putative flippase GtrA
MKNRLVHNLFIDRYEIFEKQKENACHGKRQSFIIKLMSKVKNEIKLFGRFSLVGVFNTLVGYVLIFSLMFLGVGAYLSNALGYGIGFIVSFLLNKNFVFRSRGCYLRESMKFFICMGLAYLLNLTILHFLLRLDTINPYLCQLVAGASYSTAMYLTSRKWIFLKSKA